MVSQQLSRDPSRVWQGPFFCDHHHQLDEQVHDQGHGQTDELLVAGAVSHSGDLQVCPAENLAGVLQTLS